MLIKEYIKMAMDSIRTNKMRSLLTMLGIIIGIASVITIIAAGDGAQAYMRSQFEAVGTTSVIISVNEKNSGPSDKITDEDLQALVNMADYVKGVSPEIGGWGTAEFREKEIEVTMMGGTESMETLAGINMLNGRFFSSSDNLSGRDVCIIDTNVAQKFFGTTDVIGMEIDLTIGQNKRTLQIIGVAQSPYGDFYVDGMPGQVAVPLPVALALVEQDPVYSMVYLQATSKEMTDTMGNAAINLLEARHGNRGRDIYFAQNLNAQVDMINDMMGLVQGFIVTVAAISLLVGGIGVMNIMLVAVTERTREIGIRKSLGAKTNAILFQFLTESAIITLIGGIIGLFIGVAGAFIFCSIAGITPVFTPYSIGFSLLFSAAVGIFFGIYPARKAARLNPIEALRHE